MNLDEMVEKEAARQASAEGSAIETSNDTNEQTNTGIDAVNASAEKTNEQVNAPAAAAAATNQNTNTDNDTFSPEVITQLERISGGKIKSNEDLLSAITRAQESDGLRTKVTEYEAKLAVSPYADAYEAKRNELKRSGATKEQLKAFEKVNDLGDIAEMDNLEAKITKLVLVDGFPEAVARRKVEKEFNLEGAFDTEREDLEAELAISAKADKKALESYKAEVSTPNADRIIMDAAGKAKLESDLKPVLESFSRDFTKLGTLNLNGKDKDEAVTLDLDLSESDRLAMASDIKDYLVENGLPLTQENYNDALAGARMNMVSQKLESISRDTWKKAEAHFTKMFTEKYENTGGLPRQDQRQSKPADVLAQETKAFKEGLLGGKLR